MLNYNWKIDKKAATNLLMSSETSGIALFIICLKTVGSDELFTVDEDTGYTDTMDPVELFADLQDAFNVSIPVENENRINAILTAISTDLYFSDSIAFTSISISVNSGDLGELVNGIMEAPTIEEILTTKMEIELIVEDVDFSPSVQKIITEAVKDLAEDDDPATPEYTLNEVVEEHRAKIYSELNSLGIDEKVLEYVKSYEFSL
jgi:hypothetical protein